MAKTLTITLSDDDYEALRRAASQAHVSPAELATSTVAEHLPKQSEQPEPPGQQDQSARTPEQRARDELLAFLRDHRYIVDTRTLPPHPGTENIPPDGTPERAKFEEELYDELGEAFARSGLDILDLIERR